MSVRTGIVAMLGGFGIVVVACGSEEAVIGRENSAAPDGSPSDPSFGGNDASSSPPDGSLPPGDAGPPTCPPYQSLCSGRCIPSSVDPKNCGACGKTCAPGQVCAGGTCSDDCLPGLFECGGQCVDLKTDSRHCNSCGFACPAGTGCVDGTCHPTVTVNAAGAACVDGGPAIKLDIPGSAPGKCAGQLAQTTFRWAICSCRDVELTNPLVTDAYDSTKGAYAPGQLGGSIGLNGNFTNNSTSLISGTLWSSATTGGVLTTNEATIKQELHVGGPLTINNPFTADGDAYVVGDIYTSSTVALGANLFHPAQSTITGDVSYKKLVSGPVSVPDACGCASNQLLPVEGIVAARRGTNNDNAKIGLDPNALVTPNAARRLDLPCGHYYLSKIDTNAPLVIAATGRTALYIDGDVVTTSPLAFVVDPAGELDIFVLGLFDTSAKMTVGSSNHPALTRLYIGGVGTSLRITNDVGVGGFIYSGRGKIEASNPVEVFGGVFAGDFRNTGNTTIHYDRQILAAAGACNAGAPTPAPPPSSCGTCEDCNNQACENGQCGACTTSAQCCAPLMCNNGVCVDVIK